MSNLFELNAKTANVLVVDDMDTLRLWLAYHVEEMGHTVTMAANGREAWDLLARRPFDLVLLDLMMPEMGGAEVLERMKADERLREIPVIMISGMDDHDAAVGCIAAGAEDYLPKPCDHTLLRARIVACLERKRLWDELTANYRHLKQLEELRDNLMHMMRRVPLATPVRTAESDDDIVRALASCANEAVDALGLPAARQLPALQKVVARYGRQFNMSLRDLHGALQGQPLGETALTAPAPLDSGPVSVHGGLRAAVVGRAPR